VPVVVWQTSKQIQDQYGTLARAIELYLDNAMPIEQQAALEQLVHPALIGAVAQTRLLHELANRG
jgi:hypothetical protein